MLEFFFRNVIEVTLSSSVIILLILILAKLIRKNYAAKWLYFVWLILALRLIIPFNISFVEPIFSVPEINVPLYAQESYVPETYVQETPVPPLNKPLITGLNEEQNNSAEQTALNANGDANANADAVSNPTPGYSLLPNQTASPSTVYSVQDVLAVLWFLGAAVLLSYQVSTYRKFKRLIGKESTSLTKENVINTMNQIASELKIKAAIEVKLCDRIPGPMMFGFAKKTLLLPSENFSQRDLEMILRHELVHLKRRDLWYKLILSIAGILHWFNPFVHIMIKYADRDIELSCDDEVVKGTDLNFRRYYSNAILNCLRQSLTCTTALSTHFRGGKNFIKNRFANILDLREKKRGLSSLALVLALILASSILVSCKSDTTSPITQNDLAAPELTATIPGVDLEDIQLSYDQSYLAYLENGTLKVHNLVQNKPAYERKPPFAADSALGTNTNAETNTDTDAYINAYLWLPDRNTLLYFYTKKGSNEATELYTLEFPASNDTENPPDERFNQTITQLLENGKIVDLALSTASNLIYLKAKNESSQFLMEIDIMKDITTISNPGETVDRMAVSDLYGALYFDSAIGDNSQVLALQGNERWIISPKSTDKILGLKKGTVYIGEVINGELVKIKTTSEHYFALTDNPALETEWEGVIPFQDNRVLISSKGEVIIYNHQLAYVVANGQQEEIQFEGDENYISFDGAEYIQLTKQADSTFVELRSLKTQTARQDLSKTQDLSQTYDLNSGITIEDIQGEHFKGKVMLIEDPKRIKLAVAKELGVTGERVSDMVKDRGAIAGINGGGFYDPNGTGNGAFPDGLTMTGGELVHNNVGDTAVNIVGFDDQGALVLGRMNAQQLKENNLREAVTFEPNLIVDGKPMIQGDGGWGLAPRTGIGQKADGTVIFVVIDGRQPTWSIGATLSDLMNVFIDYGAVNAVNLDGGSSSELVYDGKVISKLWNIFGERYTPTAFVVMP